MEPLDKDQITGMTQTESDLLFDKITEGVKLAIHRLVEKTKKEDGELVIARDGKVIKIKARELTNK